MNQLPLPIKPLLRIKIPTLAHFRHFSSLLTNLCAYKAQYLRAYKALYICRELSTNQPILCKTNPILSIVGGLQMNETSIITMNYENSILLAGYKNKPNSNPNKPNCRKGKIDARFIFTKDYRKKDDFSVRINKPNFSKNPKLAQTLFLQKDYENEPPPGPKKTKPKQTQFQYKKSWPKAKLPV